jgi:hypothetical protein
MSESQNQTRDNDWAEELAQDTYNIPEDTEVTKGNCRKFIDYWVRLEKTDQGTNPESSCRAGRQIHVPDPRADPPQVEPLCHTPEQNGTEWRRKDLAIFPPPWDQDKLCSKCISLLQGEDYVDKRRTD